MDETARREDDDRGYDTAIEERPDGEVGQAMASIDSALQRLLRAVNTTEAYVSPILKPEGPVAAGGEKGEDTIRCSTLAMNLQAVHSQINGLARRLEEMSSRVDL